ncbi:hypothetical protein JCM14469_21000 [Desulfatiferula olefinivorans]
MLDLKERSAGLFTIKRYDSEERLPYILINDQIRWMALPDAKMLALVKEKPIVCEALADRALPFSVHVRVYMAPQCPHCPSVIRTLIGLTDNYPRIRLTIIDATLYEQLANEDHIRSVPTVICDHGVRLTGALTEQEIFDGIFKRKPSELSPDSLRAMIESREAENLARMMIDDQMIYPAFYDLMAHDKWPVRLGAMVVVETIIDGSEALAARLVEEIWDRMEQVSASVRGDWIYLIGMAGGPRDRDRLNALQAKTDRADIKESITDALAEMERRFRG